ncbi:MAG: sigma 54-interacting transcriptional regulator, partial [Deltaproteobacteria bacterium]|nr:sigma 54-interacting transcriptional regulator [Deltaproteobacteria bacterium]
MPIAVEFISNVTRINDSNVILCNIHDITERKFIADALPKARDELEQRVQERTAELETALSEIRKIKEQLEAENIYLRDEIYLKGGFGDIIGASDPIKYVMYRARQVALTKTSVLLTGETGTGKGIFARFIHRESDRRDRPFVNVNCAGLPANLIESELFGREKGAFTGSTARQIGRFELANNGTIFLDEIGELP